MYFSVKFEIMLAPGAVRASDLRDVADALERIAGEIEGSGPVSNEIRRAVTGAAATLYEMEPPDEED